MFGMFGKIIDRSDVEMFLENDRPIRCGVTYAGAAIVKNFTSWGDLSVNLTLTLSVSKTLTRRTYELGVSVTTTLT